jgi:hypothetical protein
MSARVEAAREAVADAMIKHGPDGHIDGYEEITDAALAAADAVMFSDEAVERAARRLAHPFTWEKLSPSNQSHWRSQIVNSIVALKGSANE